jgi:hypothetical protein
MRRLELTGDGHRRQQTTGPRDAAAVGGGRWRRVGLVCGGGASVDRSAVERERERERGRGGRAVFFWLSHVSSIGYPKADENCSSFFRRLSKADENYNFIRRPSLADGSCCSFIGF